MEQSLLILLAEDESLIALTLEDALEEAGFAVHHVVAGEDAMDALERHGHGICGVITDIKLQGSVDGWAIARRAREMLPHIPVVYMSGDSAHEHTSLGVPDSIMIQKPFAPAQIITAISTLLNAIPPQPSA